MKPTSSRTKVELRPLLKDAFASGNLKVLASFLGPAYRGFVKQEGKLRDASQMNVKNPAVFDWTYRRDHPELARLVPHAGCTDNTLGCDPHGTGAVANMDSIGPIGVATVRRPRCAGGRHEYVAALTERSHAASWIGRSSVRRARASRGSEHHARSRA